MLLVSACNNSSATAAQPTPEPAPDIVQLQMPSATAVTRTSIRQLLGRGSTLAVGLTITPDTDELVLLDANSGVYKLDATRRFQMVVDMESLLVQSTNGWGFTDIAALGSDTYALTALNDGFLLDLHDNTLRQHFCYVPGQFIVEIGQTITQLTNGVAFDPTTSRIIAQPVTYTIQNQQAVRSDVATFAITGGEGDDWHPIDDLEFLSGAITVDLDGTLWLANGSDLYQYDLVHDDLLFSQSLDRFRVTDVMGMVFHNGDLVVIDNPTHEIVCIPAALL